MDGDFLLWVRGPGLVIATVVLVFGVILRLVEIVGLGRRPDLARARGRRFTGWGTILSRSLPRPEVFHRSVLTYIGGYVFHLGFFIVLLFLAPHIRLLEGVFGFAWPALPTSVIDAVTVVTLVALVVVLVHRLADPVKRFLSTPGDYVAWALTFLPVFTGYLAYHHLLFRYETLLGLHILSVELLMVALPFTKLVHTVTLFVARWYTGEAYGRRGVSA